MAITKKTATKPRVSVDSLLQIFHELVAFLKENGGALFEYTAEHWHRMKLRLNGKSIAIIGPKGSGKTTLLEILKDPNYTVDIGNYVATQGKVEFESANVVLKPPALSAGKAVEEIRFKLKKPMDVGGEAAHRSEHWAATCNDAAFLFYVFDAHEFAQNPGYLERIQGDMRWIADNNQIFAAGFQILAFANKIDRIGNCDEWAAWGDRNIPLIQGILHAELGDFETHLSTICPISLASRSKRVATLTAALMKVVERT